MRVTSTAVTGSLLIMVTAVGHAREQGAAAQPPAGAPTGQSAAQAPSGASLERPPADPAVIERGKALYGVHCTACHGTDARGTETGPDLLKSPLVSVDRKGELMALVIQNGRPDRGMPKLDLTMAQIEEIAAFVHSLRAAPSGASRAAAPGTPPGDAAAGEIYFKATCAACHSATGDLKGLATRFPEAAAIQKPWLVAAGAVVPANSHRDQAGQHNDKDVRDLTAYLLTLK